MKRRELIALIGGTAARSTGRSDGFAPLRIRNDSRVGLVKSLAHPGGNVTGLSMMATELYPKRLQLLKEVNPKLTKVAVLYNPDHPFHVKAVEELKAISPSISIELTVVAARVPEQFPSAFSDIVQTKAQALYVVEDPIFFAHRTTLLELASRQAHVASDYRRGNRVKAASHVPRLLHLLTAGIGTDATYERSRQMSAH